MKISIAMCTYNGANYLVDQLESFAQQSRLPDELVICDDRSQDATLEIIEKFRARAPFPVLLSVNETKLRSTKNFEKAIAHCTGDVIFLSDQDDVWKKEKVASILRVFEEDPEVGVLFTDADIVDRSLQDLGYGLWSSKSFSKRERKLFNTSKGACRVLLKHNVMTGATMAFRSSLVPEFMPIPACWVHDGWIAFIASVISTARCLDERLIMYRQHGANQIGGVRTTLLERVLGTFRRKLRGSTETHREKCKRRELEYQQYTAVRSKLAALMRQGLIYDDAPSVQQKLKHVKKRWSMHMRPSGRLLLALGELFLLRYHRFSLGLESFFTDIMPRP